MQTLLTFDITEAPLLCFILFCFVCVCMCVCVFGAKRKPSLAHARWAGE